jgi:hypothetical protein
MIRDLRYPEDASKEIEALHRGLRYDAAIAVLGQVCCKAPLPADIPDFSTGIRYGGVEEDKAVRRKAQGLLPRFSFVSLVSRFETHIRRLLWGTREGKNRKADPSGSPPRRAQNRRAPGTPAAALGMTALKQGARDQEPGDC